jgi:tRNA (mo5U34)-methyltransferase
MDAEQLRRRVEGIDWYHTMDLGHGVVTPGAVPLDALPEDLLPDFSRRSVLDIGTWDGANAFRAERLGADRVVALDHYAWGVDIWRRHSYWTACAQRGELPDHRRDETDFWDPSLARKRGFDLAHEALHSSVEPVVGDFMISDLDQLGSFDVVLYLGVLYHMREPLTALERVRRVTNQVAVIETEAVHLRGQGRSSLLGFCPGSELADDFGNWFLPTEAALHSLCRAAGFTGVVTKRGLASRVARWLKPMVHYRLLIHAFP